MKTGTKQLEQLTGKGALALVILMICLPVFAADGAYEFSVPAVFDRFLTLPGEGNHFLRPSGLRFDRHHDEVLVIDPGHNRIVMLDPNGTYRFEISGGDRFSTPIDVAVNSEGFIYILASSIEGIRVFRYDFDGLDLGILNLPYGDADQPLHPRSMVFDNEDRLCIVDSQANAVRIFDTDGVELGGWSVEHNSDGSMGPILGRISYGDGNLYLPMSAEGTVHVYDRTGTRLRSIGHKGNNASELNFPVAVDLSEDGMVMVLDKHRFAVLCFTQEGRFIGEFGGKGVRAGWFYHPSLLLDLGEHGVLVGQVFQNWIQRCRIPDSILARAESLASSS